MGLDDRTRFVLFAGRLHGQKDPLLLVRAFARLGDPLVHLLVAGAGELEGEVRSELCRLGLAGRATLLGPVPQERLAGLHQLASAFVLTSAYEGLPMVALEALACGTPVVTTRAGETPHLLIPGSGAVAEEFTPEAVAGSLGAVLAYPERYPAGRCAEAAEPYAARSVVPALCAEILGRWQTRAVSVPSSGPLA
jgi:glycosyltransferase involved in cell wall biosynthesis